MARTIAQIKTEMEASLVTLLPVLNSPSLVAVKKLWIDIVSAAVYTLEVLFDYHKAEVDKTVIEKAVGNLPWYQAQALKFQYGYSLILDTNTYRYNYTDTTSAAAIAAQIVTSCSVQEVQGHLLFKLAKGPDNARVPLIAAELTSFKSYLKKIKFAGDNTTAVSYDADEVRLRLRIWYDGTLDLTAFDTAVQGAIEGYLLSIPFDGIFYVNKLIDAIQAVPGVNDVIVLSAEAQTQLSGYVTFTRDYNPLSGYYKLTPVGGTVADSNIEYIAQ